MGKRLSMAIITVALILTACPQSTLQKLANASDQIAAINQGFQAAAANAKAQGLISAQEDIQLQEVVIKVAAINDKLAAAYTESAANNPTWVTDVNAALTLGANLNSSSLLFIKNPTEQKTLTTVLLGVRSLLDTIAATVKGAS